MKRKIKLTFPSERAGKPVVARLIREHDLDLNILNAHISDGMQGDMSLELEGRPENIQSGLDFLAAEGIIVRDISRSIQWDSNKCTCCGCCTAVCPTGALALNETFELAFHSDLCVVCEQCIDTCPIGTLRVNYGQ